LETYTFWSYSQEDVNKLERNLTKKGIAFSYAVTKHSVELLQKAAHELFLVNKPNLAGKVLDLVDEILKEGN
jgi:hypothetical protein